MMEKHADVAIAGGSLGGVAAALACAKMGKRVLLLEETDWIGGQATTQGVPLDEHPWIEKYGRTDSYAAFRQGVRHYYKRNYPVIPQAARDPYFNPGAGWVSALCFEPLAGVAVLNQMLAPYIASGRIEIMTGCLTTRVEMDGDRCRALIVSDTKHNCQFTVTAPYFLDATELGDLLPLARMEHVVGAESQAQTGEPLALEEANPQRQQPFTHLIAVDYLPGEDFTIDKPNNYEYWRDKYFTGLTGYPRAGAANKESRTRSLFPADDSRQYEPCIWNFRRSFCRANFEPGFFPSDITTLMNGNEYREGVLVGVEPGEARFHLERAKELSLSLVYFLQTEIESGYDGKPGFPGIRPRGDVFGTRDGLAQYPYIRESRRIAAEFTVLEQHFRTDMQKDGPLKYTDSIGLGGYRIDIHEKAKDNKSNLTLANHGKHWVQQIPLGALIPVRVENIIPCCKNIGVTHVTNGAFRLHPVEWNIGESAGYLVSHCIDKSESPRSIRNGSEKLEAFQQLLVKSGIELEWPSVAYSRSYFSHVEHWPGWHFGEAWRG